MTPARRVCLPHLHNLRDLGGYEATDGGVTAWGRLYRSDCPVRATDEEWGVLRNLGVATLVDLRSTAERLDKPVPVPEGMAYHHCPLLGEPTDATTADAASRAYMRSMSLDYAEMMERSLDGVARALLVVREALVAGHGVDFFCTAGKDRTGMVAACILHLCGVGDDDVVADYCLTEVYNAHAVARQIAAMPHEVRNSLPPGRLELATSSKPQTMRDFLSWVHERDLPALLAEHGLDVGAQLELKAALVQMR